MNQPLTFHASSRAKQILRNSVIAGLILFAVIVGIAAYFFDALGLFPSSTTLVNLSVFAIVLLTAVPIFVAIWWQTAWMSSSVLTLTDTAIEQQQRKPVSIRFDQIERVLLLRSKGEINGGLVSGNGQQIGFGIYEEPAALWAALQPRIPATATIVDNGNTGDVLQSVGLVGGTPALILLPMILSIFWRGFDESQLIVTLCGCLSGALLIFGSYRRSQTIDASLRPKRLHRLLIPLSLLGLLGSFFLLTLNPPVALDVRHPCNWLNRAETGCIDFQETVDEPFVFVDSETIRFERLGSVRERRTGAFGRLRTRALLRGSTLEARQGVRMSPNARYIAGTDYDHYWVYDLEQKQQVAQYPDEFRTEAPTFSADSTLIAYHRLNEGDAEPRSTITLLNLSDGSVYKQIPYNGHGAWLSPMDTVIAYAEDGNIILWDYVADEARVVADFDLHLSYFPDEVVFSPDGTLFAAVTRTKVAVFSAETGTHLTTIEFDSSQNWLWPQAAFSHSGNILHIVTSTQEPTEYNLLFSRRHITRLSSWSLPDGTETRNILINRSSQGSLQHVALSPDDSRIGIATDRGLFLFEQPANP